MDYYKFGNTLCRMREEHNLTQKELAKMLDVSDKAVSKWENGQAVPRMETLEKIADVLDTTVEELIVISKDNSKRICVKNSFANIAHIEIDNKIYSVKNDEEIWIELDSAKQEYMFLISGELDLDFENQIEKGDNLKEKVIHTGIKHFFKYMGKVFENCVLQADCKYTISNLSDGDKIELEYSSFSIGDRVWINEDFIIGYPKIQSNGVVAVLSEAKAKNRKDILNHKKKMALRSEIAFDIPFMLMILPFRMAYFKSVCKSEKLKEYIKKADYYNKKYKEREEKNKRRKHPVLKFVFIIIMLVVLWLGVDFAMDIINIESDMPALVSADYNQIELFRDEYVRIDEMPFDAVPIKSYGAEVWYDARLEGLPKTEQLLSEDKVTVFEDTNGKKYLWLVCDYLDTITDENGEYIAFKDFENPMVYEMIE